MRNFTQFILCSAVLVGNLYVTSSALETPFGAYKDGYANSAAYTGNSRTLIVRADSKAWMSHAFPDGSGKGLQGARLQIYVKDMVHDGVLKVSLAPSLGTLENQTHLSDLVFKDSVGSVILKAADHIQHVVEIPLSVAFTKAIQDNAYAGLVLESSGNLDVELGALEGDHGAVILLNYNSSSTVVTANVISVDSLANKLFAEHPTELRGPTGTNGSNGAKGDNGLNGKDGLQGPKGDSGTRGPQGPIGLTGAAGKDGIAGTGGSATSLPATAITGLDTFVVNRVNTNLGGKANLSGANFVGPLSTSGDFSAGGIMNVDASTPNSKYGLNVVNKYITATGGFGILLYGIGGPLETNNEWIQLSHGNNQGKLMVRAAGTGVPRDFGIYTSDVERLKVTASGNVGIGTATPASKLDVKGTIHLSQQMGIGDSGIWTPAALTIGGNIGLTGQAQYGMNVSPTFNTERDANGAPKIPGLYSGADIITGLVLGESVHILKGYGMRAGSAIIPSTSSINDLYGIYVDPQIGATNNWAIFTNSGKVHFGDNVDVTGTVTANGAQLTSDVRYKQNITTLSDALAKVLALRGVTYDWNLEKFPDHGFTKDKQIGFIAQEVEPIVPEMVSTDAKGYKSLDYAKVGPLLVEAVKDQQSQIEKLNKKINDLEALKEIVCLDHPNSAICK